jgi:2'-5' RNA ligase
MTAEDHLRVFIAVELPAAIRKELADLQNMLSPGLEPGIKWVAPDGIHLTLKFLGNVPVTLIPELQKVIEEATSRSRPFQLEIAGLGAFPSRQKPEVIWYGLQGDTDQLTQLQRQIENSLLPLEFPAETRPFSPHLTLARLRRDAGVNVRHQLAARLSENLPVSGSAFTVETVSLMQSRLTPTGPIYTRLAEFLLSSSNQGRS